MREMKDSGVEWIGSIPEDWIVRPVKSAFYRKKEKAQQENPVILSLARSGVKVRDIESNEGQLAESYFDYNPVAVGDLLINPMDLYSGANCNMSEIEGVISPAYVNLKAFDEFDAKYYDYYFKTQYWSMAFFAHGFGVSYENRWTLNNETLKNYKIPVPTYEEQVRLRSFLNQKVILIDNIIDKTKESIEEYKKLKQSIITEAVTKGLNPDVKMKDSWIEWIGEIPEGWEVLPIKKIFTFNKGLNITKEELRESGLSVINYGQIHSKNNKSYVFNEDLMRFIPMDSNVITDDELVKLGDFVFADTSEDLDGTGNFIYNDGVNILYAGYHTIIAKLKEQNLTLAKYFSFLFLSDTWRTQIRSQVSGIKLFSLTQKILKSTKILMPPLEECELIIRRVESQALIVEKLIKEKERIIVELEEYKKSLIYEVVTGKKEIE